jgi:hypothetical protein
MRSVDKTREQENEADDVKHKSRHLATRRASNAVTAVRRPLFQPADARKLHVVNMPLEAATDWLAIPVHAVPSCFRDDFDDWLAAPRAPIGAAAEG